MLGIVCGLKAEADIANTIEDALVVCSGARPNKARQLTQNLINKGAKTLISFGLAGGLDPALRSGDLILGSSVRTEKQFWMCDEPLLDKVKQNLPDAISGAIWGTEEILTKALDKRDLFQKTNCLAADMESHAMAEVATDANIPFIIIRAIADTDNMNLPLAALVPLHEEGSVDGLNVAKSLIKNPRQIPALLCLGLNTSKAMKTLKQAAQGINAMKD